MEPEFFFVGFGFPTFWVLYMWWFVILPKKRHTFGMYAFHRYHWFVCEQLFPVWAVRKVPENHRCGSGSADVRNFRNFSWRWTPLPTHLWICHQDCGDPLNITGVMEHFVYYKRPGAAGTSRSCADVKIISYRWNRRFFLRRTGWTE